MVVVVFRVFVVRLDGVGFMVTDSAVVVVGLVALCGFVDCLFGDLVILVLLFRVAIHGLLCGVLTVVSDFGGFLVWFDAGLCGVMVVVWLLMRALVVWWLMWELWL